jgi:transcriptional regulator with XRE-family HTH domain
MLAQPVGKRIRYARDRAGLSQRQLAELLGLDGPDDRIRIIKWEKGEMRPLRRYRELLAEATGYPIEFFRHDGPEGLDD